MMHVNTLIDRLVATINTGYRELLPPELVPPALRVAELDGYYDWHIRPAELLDKITLLEAHLPLPFPASYRSLVTRYAFPCFDFGPMNLDANTQEETRRDIAVFHREHEDIARYLMHYRLIRIGDLVDGSHSLVCFDAHACAPGEEPPLVRLSLEAPGDVSTPPEISPIASSFPTLLASLLSGGPGEA